MSIWTQITPLWEVNMSFETQAIPSWELITSLWKEKSSFEAQHLIIHKLNKRLCYSDSNFFCKQGFERTVSDSDYENTVKIIGCDSHDKRFPSLTLCSHPTLFHLIIWQTPDLCWLQLHAPIPILKSLLTIAEIDCEQSLSFPSVFLAFFYQSYRVASGEPQKARARRKRKKKETVFFLPLPIPSSFRSLICIISTEFRARRISGTKTDYS